MSDDDTRVFKPTPTMKAFMLSKSYVKVLGGPFAGGKSVCCVYELLRRAQNQKPNKDGIRRSKWLVVRNTADQLRQTTWQTFSEWVKPGQAGEWKPSEKTFSLHAAHKDGTRIEATFLFIALDTPDDVRKALSLEATGLWGNECRELHPDVVDGLLGRINRFPPKTDGGATEPGAIFDTNMPEEDTWWSDMMTSPPDNWSVHTQPSAVLTVGEFIATYPNRELPEVIDGEWIINPDADNLVNLADDYYPNLLPGKKRGWVDVYLRCQFGKSVGGKPVFTSFSPAMHVAKKLLVYNPQLKLVIGLDPGMNTGAVLCQQDLYGRLLVLDEIVTEGMGAARFVDDRLKPLLRNKYPDADVLIVPDPAADNRSQADEQTVVQVLRRKGFKVQPAHTNKIESRLSAGDSFLNRMVEGEAAMLIDPRCKKLIKALGGGYKYAVNQKGVTAAVPSKDEHSHVADAFTYSCGYFQRDGDRAARAKARTTASPTWSPASHLGY